MFVPVSSVPNGTHVPAVQPECLCSGGCAHECTRFLQRLSQAPRASVVQGGTPDAWLVAPPIMPRPVPRTAAVMAPFRPQAMVRHGVTKHLHNVPQGINPKQRNRILARRQLKISRIQSDTQSVLTRLHLHGSAPGCKPPARHPSRKAHAESRARGPHGRFLRKGELAAVREIEPGAEESHHVSPVIQPTDSAVPAGTFLAPSLLVPRLTLCPAM